MKGALLAAAALWSLSAAAEDASFAGVYLSEPKNICVPGGCSKMRDELTISVNPPGAAAPMRVELETVWANGHMCNFHADGRVEADELVAAEPSHPECPLTVTRRADAVELAMPKNCNVHFCGARGSIGGDLLHKAACAPPEAAQQANERTASGCAED